MKATITTLLLALAPALPIISALPSEKLQLEPLSRDFPITKFCSGISIASDGNLQADDCDGVSNVKIDLDSCIGNFGGALGYVTDAGDGNYSRTCYDCSLDADAVMTCFCGQGPGKDFISAHIDLRDCQFLWYDQGKKGFNCGDLKRECPNSG
ncbi:hypothetical protein F4820DRAFT_454145 [Hypoxylon rubiginosum]|uniref:Uncharacterized protein n=1 Tax=Hypoxylon rubiginosum TaxID=110542 RepID=A0ACB9YIM4_9PEZI|nr:hypothetical protein F4820DRAFT_454145 [Hypoxylon rubiginosum]